MPRERPCQLKSIRSAFSSTIQFLIFGRHVVSLTVCLMLSRQRNSSIVLCTIRGSYLDSLRHELSSNGSDAEWSLHEFSYITCHPGITFSYKRLHSVCLGQTKFSCYTCIIMCDVYNICSWTQSADCMLRYIILTNGMMTINTFGIQCIQSINQISLFFCCCRSPIIASQGTRQTTIKVTVP